MTIVELPDQASGGAHTASLLSALVRSPTALFAVAIVAVIVACALFSPLIAPYDPGAQSLAGRLLPPLTSPVFWLICVPTSFLPVSTVTLT